jgi:hypothetical protein
VAAARIGTYAPSSAPFFQKTTEIVPGDFASTNKSAEIESRYATRPLNRWYSVGAKDAVAAVLGERMRAGVPGCTVT